MLGGFAGSAIGNGVESELASVLGGIADAVVGQKVEEYSTRRQGQEITIARDSKPSMVVAQEVENGKLFQPGDQVRLITNGGTVRVRY